MADDPIVSSALFFPPGTKLVALPSWEKPRLLLERRSAPELWRVSSFYPAFRPAARAFKTALRLKTALRFGEVREVPSDNWALGAFVEPVLPGVTSVALLIGTPGPAQKLTAQLWRGETVVGYLKYGATPAACARLDREYRVLSSLPPDTGPKPLKHGAFGKGAALVTEAVPGQALPARLPVSADARAFLKRLEREERRSLAIHPAVVRLLERDRATVAPWLQGLDRDYPLAYQHGDFAPWNLLRDSAGKVRAIDWEYGDAEGLPYLDLAYYCLQVGTLLQRWSPQRAKNYAVKQLSEELPPPEAEAFVKLAAFHAYVQALDDGHAESVPLQAWRREVWS